MNFPKLYGGGEFIIEVHDNSLDKCQQMNETEIVKMKRHSFIIMEKLGHTLQHYFYKRQKAFSLKTVCQIGIKLIEIIKQIHDIGYVYNDLKLDNILIGDQHSNLNSMHEIKLIDFGFATKFVDQNGNHLKLDKQPFRGNMAFCSKNAMNFETQSRRDDLISLNYILLYLHQGKYEILRNLKNEGQFDQLKQRKNESTPESLCGDTSKIFLPFTRQIMSMGFYQEPNYNKLQFTLLKCLLDNDIILSQEYDWTNSDSY